MASTMVLLPVPLFPRIPVIPSLNTTSWCRYRRKFRICSLRSCIVLTCVTGHDPPDHLSSLPEDKFALLLREVPALQVFPEEIHVIHAGEIPPSAERGFRCFGSDGDPQIEDSGPCLLEDLRVHRLEEPAVCSREGDDGHDGLPGARGLRDLAEDCLSYLPGREGGALELSKIYHGGAREVYVVNRVPVQVHEEPALGIMDLAVGDVLLGPAIPCIVCDLFLAMKVAEGDVIKLRGEHGRIDLMLHDRPQPAILESTRKPVGDENVASSPERLHLVELFPVLAGLEEVRDEMEPAVAQVDLFVMRSVPGMEGRPVVLEHLEGGGGVPGLPHVMIPRDDDEGDPRIPQPGKGFEGGGVGEGLGPDRVEEIPRMDHRLRLHRDDGVDTTEEVPVDQALPEVHPIAGQAAELREAQMAVTDMDEPHLSPARRSSPAFIELVLAA